MHDYVSIISIRTANLLFQFHCADTVNFTVKIMIATDEMDIFYFRAHLDR